MGRQQVLPGTDLRRAQFNGAWLGVIILLIAAGLVTQQRALVALAACIAVVIPTAWLWRSLALWQLVYERRFDKLRAFPGEVFELTVRVTNQKLLPLSWLEISDEISNTLPLVEGELTPTSVPRVGTLDQVFALRWFQRVIRHHALRATARGIYALGPVHLTSGDPFALFEIRDDVSSSDRLIVYPPIWPLEDLGLPATEPFGETRAARRLIDDPLRTVGIRAYHPEDDLRHIHWKATAHRNELQVRLFEPAATRSLVILLNVNTLRHHWQGSIPELF